MRARGRRSHLVALAVVAALSVAGCGSDTPSPVSTVPRTTSPEPADVTILALGDSTVWDHDCVDCSHSYPHQLRDALATSTGKRIGLVDATRTTS